jgi:succinylglutamate desuccinylase
MENIEGSSVIAGHAGDTCVIVIGAEHGNEPAGVKAIERLRALVDSGDWRVDCTILGLIGNPRALGKDVRFIDENLNRAFGRSTSGTYEDARASEIAQWLRDMRSAFEKIYVLDLHSVSVGETRIAIVMSAERAPLAQAVSPIPFKLIAPPDIIPGTLLGFAESLGMTGLVVECGNHSSPQGEIVAMEHIERLLQHIGALSSKTTSFFGRVAYEGPERTYELIEAIRPSEGFAWSRPISSELALRKGEEYAHDPHGTRVAPYDCFVIMPSKVPEPSDYDAGFLARRA